MLKLLPLTDPIPGKQVNITKVIDMSSTKIGAMVKWFDRSGILFANALLNLQWNVFRK